MPPRRTSSISGPSWPSSGLYSSRCPAHRFHGLGRRQRQGSGAGALDSAPAPPAPTEHSWTPAAGGHEEHGLDRPRAPQHETIQSHRGSRRGRRPRSRSRPRPRPGSAVFAVGRSARWWLRVHRRGGSNSGAGMGPGEPAVGANDPLIQPRPGGPSLRFQVHTGPHISGFSAPCSGGQPRASTLRRAERPARSASSVRRTVDAVPRHAAHCAAVSGTVPKTVRAHGS